MVSRRFDWTTPGDGRLETVSFEHQTRIGRFAAPGGDTTVYTMILFRILFGIDALAAAVVLFFFVWGLSDGTVSSFNILLWLALLGGCAGILGGGLLLNAYGQRRIANGVLLILAFPAFMIGLFFLAVIILQPRWN